MAELQTQGLGIRIGDVRVCRDLDLHVREGESWCILGRNGTGKTTLLHTLAGLLPPVAGTIAVNGQPLQTLPRRTIARQIGILFQDHRDAFPANVLETVLAGRHPWLGPLQWETSADLALAHKALHAVGLVDMEQRIITTLSGGERRRLGIATLLVQDPQLLLLDEPTNHLDPRHQLKIMWMVREHVQRADGSALAALHDINLAARYCSHVVMLFGNGEWCAGETGAMLDETRLERLYGCPVERLEGSQGPRFHPADPSAAAD